MNLTLRDFASMRLPMAILAVVLVASFAMVKTTSLRHDTAAGQLRTQERALLDARQRVERSGLEREAILTHLPAYRKLEEEGLVGPEQRIEWLESLRAANKQAGLFGVGYQIEPRKPFLLIGQGNPVAQHMHQTPMKLTIGLVHEGDLLRFFDRLAAQGKGTFLIRKCVLDSPAQLDDPGPKRPNLNAECELSWLTIDPPGASS